MTLGETERDRLADVRELQPTTNAELGDRWGVNSGSEVSAYLRDELEEYTYRDENSKIRVDTDAPTDTDAEDTPSEHPDAASQETDATPSSRDSEPEADVTPSDSDDGPSAGDNTVQAAAVVDEETDDDDTDSDPSDNPVFGDADPDADIGDTDSVELPCGCESFDENEAPERPFEVTCSSCGKRYKVTPESEEESDDAPVELPCGCESYDPTDAPDEPFVVSCGTCGERYKVKA